MSASHRLPPLIAQTRLHTPLGPMTAAVTALGLCGLWFDDERHHPGPLDAPADPDHPWLHQTADLLTTYFDGWQAPGSPLTALGALQAAAVSRPPSGHPHLPETSAITLALTDLDGSTHLWRSGEADTPRLPLDLRSGTPFQQAVWQVLAALRTAERPSYQDLADRLAPVLGRRTSPRAVGSAVGRNPVTLLVPCHRVIGRDGSLTGYAGGLPRKQALLQWEAASLAPC